ncbi:MAG TPA: phosphoribosyltransferase family protein [Chitinophagaceae bacterium]|nr:phosphoribosyltransferase family protein [Chitinophagaceae bacterium]
MRSIEYIGRSLSHLFFPQVCFGCGSDLVLRQQLLCLQCVHQLPYTGFQLRANNPVEKIFWGRLRIEQAAAVFYLTKDSVLENLLYQLKYKGNKETGLYCGRIMGEALRHTPFTEADALVPLPLFAEKERKRGYNQAALLCEGMAAAMHKPVWKNTVQRVTGTQTQTRKNRVQRWENMQGRFMVSDAAKITGKHVLLVDDVITTGATLEACGTELVAAGARVSLATLGYAATGNV